MAKNKRGGNPSVNAKKENIEKLKAEKIKSAEEQWKDLVATMSEEEAKDFVDKVDLLAREQNLKEREETVKAIQSEFNGIEQELDRRDGEQNDRQTQIDDRETAVGARETTVSSRETQADKKESELMNRERSIIERENNAENEFALQNRRALETLRLRKEELDRDIAALEQRRIDKEKEIEVFIEGLRTKEIEALEEEIDRFDKERREAAQKKRIKSLKLLKGLLSLKRLRLQRS